MIKIKLNKFFQIKIYSRNFNFLKDNQFIVDKMLPAMWDDGYATSRSIIMSIHDQSDLVKAFDEFAYNKGAALIRMFESVIQENELFQGLKVKLFFPFDYNFFKINFFKEISTNKTIWCCYIR